MKASSVLFLVLPLLVAGCGDSALTPGNKPDLRSLSFAEKTLSVSNGQFAFDLYKEVTKTSSGNIIVSPLSVGLALGMTLNAAAGTTAEGILKTINFSDLQPADVNEGYYDLTSLLTAMDHKVELSIANSIWYEKDLTVNPDFASIITNQYRGTIQGLDFQNAHSKDVINGWVSDHTGHHINDLLDNTGGYAMVLINAMYFKGQWTYQFDKSKTKKDLFHRTDGSSVQTDMMFCEQAKVVHLDADSLQLIDIPYGNGQFRMTVLLPATKSSLPQMLHSLDGDSFGRYLANADTVGAILTMPKFSFGWKKTLNVELSDMGMADAFTDAASFPNLFTNVKNLAISDVVHQAMIETNEAGSTAAAATSVGIVVTSVIDPLAFHVDRPFLFVIRESHSNVVLFVGQVADPSVN